MPYYFTYKALTFDIPCTPGTLLMTQVQWYLSWEELITLPPSIKGRTWQEEWHDRRTGCEFISKLGNSLALQQIIIATAQVFFHRFYLRESFKKYKLYDLAMACTFLAAKVEESPRKLKDVLHQAIAIRFKNNSVIMDQFAEGGEDYRKLYDGTLGLEKLVMVVNCFDLTLDHPYRHLARLFKEGQFDETVTKEMWSILNDSFLTPLCLLFPARILSLALLMGKLGLKSGDELLRKHLPNRATWPEAFPKADQKEVEAAIQFIFHSHATEHFKIN